MIQITDINFPKNSLKITFQVVSKITPKSFLIFADICETMMFREFNTSKDLRNPLKELFENPEIKEEIFDKTFEMLIEKNRNQDYPITFNAKHTPEQREISLNVNPKELPLRWNFRHINGTTCAMGTIPAKFMPFGVRIGINPILTKQQVIDYLQNAITYVKEGDDSNNLEYYKIQLKDQSDEKK